MDLLGYITQNAPQLEILKCNECDISGELSPEIFNGLTQLGYFDISRNKISGPIPALPASLKECYLHDNKLTGKLPSSIGQLKSLEVFSAWGNQLEGELSPELFKGLTQLKFFSISRNKISGAIPSSIGDCKSLERLRLNSNNLSGQLPNELGSLARLQVLRLDNNNFTGTKEPRESELRRLLPNCAGIYA